MQAQFQHLEAVNSSTKGREKSPLPKPHCLSHKPPVFNQEACHLRHDAQTRVGRVMTCLHI